MQSYGLKTDDKHGKERSTPIKLAEVYRPSVQLEAVVRRIKRLVQNPQARILVFSTWLEVLDVLSHALKENGIVFAFARTPKQLGPAIEKLQDSSNAMPALERPGLQPLQTLLLPIKLGGNGLNLTGKPSTNHVAINLNHTSRDCTYVCHCSDGQS